MRASVSVRKVKHPRYKFRAYYPQTLEDGATVRRAAFFGTRAEAQAFAAEKEMEVTNHGTQHGTVEYAERAALVRYRKWAAKRPTCGLRMWRHGCTAWEYRRSLGGIMLAQSAAYSPSPSNAAIFQLHR